MFQKGLNSKDLEANQSRGTVVSNPLQRQGCEDSTEVAPAHALMHADWGAPSAAVAQAALRPDVRECLRWGWSHCSTCRRGPAEGWTWWGLQGPTSAVLPVTCCTASADGCCMACLLWCARCSDVDASSWSVMLATHKPLSWAHKRLSLSLSLLPLDQLCLHIS